MLRSTFEEIWFSVHHTCSHGLYSTGQTVERTPKRNDIEIPKMCLARPQMSDSDSMSRTANSEKDPVIISKLKLPNRICRRPEGVSWLTYYARISTSLLPLHKYFASCEPE